MDQVFREYHRLTAEAEYEKARALATQNRKAKAQEHLREAKYWMAKCNEDEILGLKNSIMLLERKLAL